MALKQNSWPLRVPDITNSFKLKGPGVSLPYTTNSEGEKEALSREFCKKDSLVKLLNGLEDTSVRKMLLKCFI